MNEHELALLRRKTILGTIAAAAWGLGLLLWTDTVSFDAFGPVLVMVGWVLTAVWVALDASYRGRSVFLWTIFAVASAPVATLIYVVSAPPTIAICAQCGNQLSSTAQACPICGKQHVTGRVASAINEAYTSVADSLTRTPIELARQTARSIAIGLGIASLFGLLLNSGGRLMGPLMILFVLCFGGYWIVVAWWVYLDASWRRMEPTPWALLALLTNVVGLVTYLVIRYPDPRTCPKCGADLPVGLKRCPYCGSEAEATCPRCQSPIRPDWVFCPSCATQLPVAASQATGVGVGATAKPPAISISGTVIDVSTGLPLQGAEVRVDSKDEAARSISDVAGRFLLSELDPRPYVLIASAPGYTSQAKAFTPMAVGAGQCHFTLMPSRTPAEVKAEAER